MTPPVFDSEGFLRRLWQLDAALVEAGFPATSPWWRAQIERFVRSGCRRWVIRAGRRAGKSSTLCRLAVAWAWFGPWSVPPGDAPVLAFVSVSKDEAAARLRMIAKIHEALGLKSAPRGDELVGVRGVVFKVFAATTSAVVGFTSIAIFGDEVARWESRDTAANPAREVLGSLRPTGATQPFAFEAQCSSPWGTDDYHAEQFDAGDTEHQRVSFAPTWTANPTITEERTHELEPDPRTWSREYAAEPGAAVSAALDPADVADAFDSLLPKGRPDRGFLAIDASSLRGDAFTWIAGHATSAGEVHVLEVDGFEGEELRRVSMADVVRRIAERARAWNAATIFGDQREEAALRSMFSEHGVHLTTFAWSEPSKDEAMQLLRRLMRERRVILPEHAALRRELTSMKARLMPSGRTSYATNGLDYASALVTLAHAVVASDVLLDGSHNDDARELARLAYELDRNPEGSRWDRMPGHGY